MTITLAILPRSSPIRTPLLILHTMLRIGGYSDHCHLSVTRHVFIPLTIARRTSPFTLMEWIVTVLLCATLAFSFIHATPCHAVLLCATFVFSFLHAMPCHAMPAVYPCHAMLCQPCVMCHIRVFMYPCHAVSQSVYSPHGQHG